MEPTPRGPMALPGRYRVSLIVDGKTYTQPLTLEPDPRVKATASDLAQQHMLEMQIVGAMQQAWNALQQARLAGNAQFAGGEGASTGRDTFTSLLNLLGSLEDVVDSADGAPTEQSQSAFHDLKQRLDTLIGEWSKRQPGR